MTERYFRKNIFLILFILIILSREIYSFSFDGLYIEQGLSYYNYQPIELYGEFRLFYSGNAGRYLHLNGTLGTGYKKWTDHYQVETLVWAMDVEYTPLIGIGLSVGHKLINYSPYVFHSELRQDNFLQGLFVKIDESEKIKLQGFIAMHAEDNTTIPITYSKTNRVYSFDPSQNYPLNIGNIPEQFYNNVWQEHPALWGGALLNLNPIDQISIQEIFLHENYQIDKTGEGYYTYQNDILESSLLFSPSSWFNIKLLYAMMSKNVQAYKGIWNLYGEGKHGIAFDFEKHSVPTLYEISAKLQSMDEEERAMSRIELSFTYRSIDKDYHPLHMNNGRFDEGRGEDELDDIFSGEKGYLVKLNKPFSSKWGLSLEKIQLHEGIVYDVYLDDTRNEWRYGFYGQKIFNFFRFNVIYRTIKFDQTQFKNNSNELKGVVGSLGVDMASFFTAEFSFVQHRYWITNNDEYLLKLMFQF